MPICFSSCSDSNGDFEQPYLGWELSIDRALEYTSMPYADVGFMYDLEPANLEKNN